MEHQEQQEQRHVILNALTDQCQTCCIPLSEQSEDGGRCSGCKVFHYCSRACQAADWDAGHDIECASIQSGIADWNLHNLDLDLIGAKAKITDGSLQTIRLSGLLGEGAFGAVFKSSDSMYAVKIQEGVLDCLREARIQNSLAKLPRVSVAKVYYYSNRITTIPVKWQSVIERTSKGKGATWAAAGWKGNFCIMIMDFLNTEKKLIPEAISAKNMPAYAFGLIYTVQTGYDKLRFQHLDIHIGNVATVPSSTGKYTVSECQPGKRGGVQWQFRGISSTVRLLDFGISRTRKFPATELFNYQVSPPEALSQQISRSIVTPTAGFDNYSIGLLLLNTVFSAQHRRFVTLVAHMPFQGMESLQMQDPRTAAVLATCVLQYAIGNGVHPKRGNYAPGTYDEFIHVQRRQQLEQLCQYNAPPVVQLLQEAKRLYGSDFVALVKQLVSWDPDERRVNLASHPYFAPFRRRCSKPDVKELKNAKGKRTGIVLGPKQKSDRETRLDKNFMYLYHQTDAATAKIIVDSQKFILGSTGWAGGGIYFALTPEATGTKAHKQGAILKAKVRLGSVWYMAESDRTMNFKKLLALNADSVVLSRPTGPEYVVYHPDQVKDITIYKKLKRM